MAKGRTYPSLVACVVGATVGITLGSLVVPSSNDRIAADTDLVTTHTASTPSSEPTTESTGTRPQSPEGRKPSGTGTPRATAEDEPPESRTTGNDGQAEDAGDPDAPEHDGSQDSSRNDDSDRTDDQSDTQADEPGDTSSESPESDQSTPDRSPPRTSEEPDDSESTDESDEPDQPDESDEPDAPDDSEESPEEPEQSAPPTMDTDLPEPIPTDPEEREEYCLGLDLSLLELLLCLG